MIDRLLRLCLRAYPRRMRARDGEVVLDLARELVDEGSPPLRQAAGLLRGGARARLRPGPDAVQLPWFEARSRLVLPLAAALLALTLVGAERSTAGLAWIGWSWALALAGSLAAVAGAAFGRRSLAAPGAVVVAAMLAVDAARDLYGSGSRWPVGVGSAVVDVLVMWLPAALLLIACAGSVERIAPPKGLRRIAWATVPGAALLLLSTERVAAAEAVLVLGGFVAAAACLVAGVLRRRDDPAGTLASALVLAAAAPSAIWLSTTLIPIADDWVVVLPLAYFAVTGTATVAVMRALVGLARR